MQYLKSLNAKLKGTAYRYYFWFENPNPAKDGDFTGQQIRFDRDGQTNDGKVNKPVTLSGRNINLAVDAGILIKLDTTNSRFEFRPSSPAAFQFSNSIPQNRTFGAVTGSAFLALNLQSLPNLPMPETPGAFWMNAALTVSSAASDFQVMRTALEYFYRSDPLVRSQLYPVFQLPQNATTIATIASFDLLHPAHPDKTSFSFVAAGAQPLPTFDTSLVTHNGHMVYLTPVSRQSGLGGQADKVLISAGVQQDAVYFAPKGKYILGYNATPPGRGAAVPGTTDARLLCGQSGIETILFTPPSPTYSGDILIFYPGQPAYAPRFPLPELSVSDPAVGDAIGPVLDTTFQTSWVSIARGQPIPGGNPPSPNSYQAQPHGSPVYGKGAGIGAAVKSVLGFLEMDAAELTLSDAAHSFPLVPYSGTVISQPASSFSPADVPAFEERLISPTRRRMIRAMKDATGALDTRVAAKRATALRAAGTARPGTTPQGLLVHVDEDTGQWLDLLIGRNTAGGQVYELGFSNVNPVLQDGFQTNQQFLVITNPHPAWNNATGSESGKSNADQTVFKNSMRLGDWAFETNLPKGNVFGDYRNVLIFKFTAGKLSDLVKNPRKWTNPKDFNNSDNNELLFISQWLQDYIDQARQLAAGDPFYRNFISIADSDSWNGILALKVDIPVSQFPSSLKGLLGGIDVSRLNAHHLGIEVNYVTDTGAGLTAGDSSIFALISYMDPAYAAQLANGGSADMPVPSAPGEFDFKVLSLQVLFENSAIKGFSSKVQVTANKWFGDSVAGLSADLAGGLSNSIVLNGTYENHDGTPTFAFSSEGNNVFLLGSNILGAVNILKAQFNTLTDPSAPQGLVRSRFSFVGRMNFRSVKGFDLFSFGSGWASGQPGPGDGLFFSNLYITMEFDLGAPAARTFAFDPTSLTFDLKESVARPASLYANFPISLTGLVRSEDGKSPTDLGYLPVSIRGASLAGLSGSWYGLTFKLDMGTLGALAGDAGLIAAPLFAWSAGSGSASPDSFNAFAGITLPGAGGGQAKLFSLQGILRLSIKDIQWMTGTTQEGGQAYLMKFTNIALQFLGIKFPPSGNTVFFLFGDPDPRAPKSNLGWYAGYAKKPASTQPALKPGENTE
jgi:hypothetical protein